MKTRVSVLAMVVWISGCSGPKLTPVRQVPQTPPGTGKLVESEEALIAECDKVKVFGDRIEHIRTQCPENPKPHAPVLSWGNHPWKVANTSMQLVVVRIICSIADTSSNEDQREPETLLLLPGQQQSHFGQTTMLRGRYDPGATVTVTARTRIERLVSPNPEQWELIKNCDDSCRFDVPWD